MKLSAPREIREKMSSEKHYYLTSHALEADKRGAMVRIHWGIENRCHWVLHVTLYKDQCRARKANAAQDLALLRKPTLNLLRHEKTIKDTIRGKRVRAALWEKTLESLMKLKSPE